MKTVYWIYRADASQPERGEIDWPIEPGYARIKEVVEPLLGKEEPLEHVSVLHWDRRCDMFVSELGHMALTHREPLPINEVATTIYRHNWLTKHPTDVAATLPNIAGTAVLFERIVWT